MGRHFSLRHLPGLVLCCTQLCALLYFAAGSDVIRIGGLFDRPELRQEAVFRSAVASVNSDGRLLSHSRLSATVETAPPRDSFAAAKRACLILQSGVAALFGPQSCHSSAHVQSMCSAKHVPHILTRWEYSVSSDPYSVNLYPHPSTLSRAYSSVLIALGWSKFTVIYESVDGLARVQELLKNDVFRITLRQLPEGDDYRPLLKEAKKSGSTHIVLDLERLRISEVLTQAQQIDMLSSYNHYFITSLDLHTINLDSFRHGGSNITALRLVDPGNPLLMQVLKDLAVGDAAKSIAEDQPSWSHVFPAGPDAALTRPDEDPGDANQSHRSNNRPGHGTEDTRYPNESSLQTEVALVYDAVLLLATAADGLHRSKPLDVPPLPCDEKRVWTHGGAFVKYLKWVQLSGLSGLVRFDESGFRTDVALDVIELTKAGLTKVGRWSAPTGVEFSREHVSQSSLSPLSNRTLIATTVLAAPYTMLRSTSSSGGSPYEGFCADLLNEIAQELGFSYTLRLTKDGQHGKYDQSQERWTGMIGELLNQEADLAIGDLTITYEREQVVDFTMPWMNLGISILYHKATRRPPNLFSFFAPLSIDVWLYIATSYLAVSFVLHVLGRLSPYERIETESQFSLSNSLWFTIGSLLQQGTEQQPRAASTRIVAGMWWFFTLIMISSYTANLAAFLTVERMVSPIESAENLAAQTRIKYGALHGGSTWNFFSTSRVTTFQKMFSFMESQRPSVYTTSNQEGVERVLHGGGQYAFLMESSSIEYVTERYCRLTQVGGLLDAKGYGIAFPSGSPYRVLVNDAVLRLQESGRLRHLRRKWWKEYHGGGCETSDDQPSLSTKASALGLGSVGGVFAVLAAGLLLAAAVAVVEFIWNARQRALKDPVPHCEGVCGALRRVVCTAASAKSVDGDDPHSVESLSSSNAGHYGPTPGHLKTIEACPTLSVDKIEACSSFSLHDIPPPSLADFQHNRLTKWVPSSSSCGLQSSVTEVIANPLPAGLSSTGSASYLMGVVNREQPCQSVAIEGGKEFRTTVRKMTTGVSDATHTDSDDCSQAPDITMQMCPVTRSSYL